MEPLIGRHEETTRLPIELYRLLALQPFQGKALARENKICAQGSHETFARQPFDGCKFRNSPRAGDADYFAFEIAQFVDTLRSDQNLIDVNRVPPRQ